MSKEKRAGGCVIWRLRPNKADASDAMNPRDTGSAGKVRADDVEILLVDLGKPWGWMLPVAVRGKREGARDAAVRAAAEFAGFDAALAQPLQSSYLKGPGGKPGMRISFWLAQELQPGHPALALRKGQKRYRKHSKARPHRWVGLAEAAEILGAGPHTKPLAKLAAKVAKIQKHGELNTRAVLFVRHARARKRSVWKGPEDTRPLTPQGAERAAEIAYDLSNYGITWLVSSPWKRCMDTLYPYARWTGLKIETAPELTEAAYAKDPKRAAQTIHDFLVSSQSPAAVSLHRPTLPGVLEEAGLHARGSVKKRIPKKDPYLKTGEILALHMMGSTAVAAEKFRPISLEYRTAADLRPAAALKR